MPRDSQSHRCRILPTRAAQILGVLVTAVFLCTGCASSDMIPAVLHESLENRSEHSTIRSQSESLNSEWPRSNNHQGSSELRTGHSQLSGQNSAPRTAVPGHSFTQPKARLGRPILIPQTTASVLSSSTTDPESVSKIESGVESAADTVSNANTTGQNPWLSQEQNAWQALPDRRHSDTRMPETLLNGKKQSRSSSVNGNGPQSTVPAVGSGISSESPPSITDTPIQTTNNEQPEVNGETANPESEPQPEQLAPQEPTMFDRLRGLYNPRVEENTDKVRKQFLKIPDPFGLLKERDTPESSAAEIPNGVESPVEPQTADLSTPATNNAMALQNPESAIVTAISELEKQLAEWPRKPSGKPQKPAEWRQKQTDLRLLYMIAGRSAESVRNIDSLPEGEQEFWQSLMLSMNRYRDTAEDSTRSEQLTESLDHLRTAARSLQPLSQLSIPRVMLCDRIDGFGRVVAYRTSNFEPGQRILVYAELQNFKSELTADGKYRAEFSATIEFMREGEDEVVEEIKVPPIEDLCDVERTDYFQSFELTLPALEGNYLMRIQLHDQLSRQKADSKLEFSVRSTSNSL